MRLVAYAKKKPITNWTRAAGNPILSAGAAWETTSVQEPSVLYEAGTWKMWYTGGWAAPAMGYATCTGDPTVAANWTKYAGNPVLGQGGSGVAGFVSGNNVVRVGSTYYAYYYDANGGGNLKVSTSSDGIAWGTPTTAIAKGAASWMPGGWANTFVWNEGGSTWKMLVEGSTNVSGGPLWGTSYATSTDGLSWTVQGTGQVSGFSSLSNPGGPWLAYGGQKINGLYHLFLHAGGTPCSDIYHAYSADAQSWTLTTIPDAELRHNTGTYEVQQAADPSVVEANGTSYLFYDGVDNANSKAFINVATYPGTLASKVLWET